MAGVNKVILVGNLGKDPEIRSFEGGNKVASFSLATTESYKNKNGEKVEQTEWHNISFWGPIADVIEKYLRKGSQVYIEGRLRTRSYDDKDGIKKYITEVVGQNMTMLGGGPRNGESSAPRNTTSSSEPVAVPTSALAEPDTDDLPF